MLARRCLPLFAACASLASAQNATARPLQRSKRKPDGKTAGSKAKVARGNPGSDEPLAPGLQLLQQRALGLGWTAAPGVNGVQVPCAAFRMFSRAAIWSPLDALRRTANRFATGAVKHRLTKWVCPAFVRWGCAN